MPSTELLAGLLQATLAGSAAIVMVLALRRPLRRAFGVGVAYAAWLLVPAALLASVLPAPVAQLAPAPLAQVLVMPAQWMVVRAAPAVAWLDWRWGLVAMWSLGAVACGLWMWRVQSRFRRSVTPLVPHAGVWRSQAARAGLPATLGLWRPQVVLPADFDTRFNAEQRALVLAHEQAHIARGDLRSNFVAAVLRCLFWFNPLFHIAVLRMRNDQELACDADVLARQPHARRCYGDALLQVQLVMQASPLGCHFGFGHPLKERIAMLAKPVSTTQRWLGRSVLTCLLLGGGYAAWAAQPAVPSVVVPADGIAADVVLRVDENAPKVLHVVSKVGKPFSLETDADGRRFVIVGTVTRVKHQGKPALALVLRIDEDGKQVAEPKLIALNGKPAAIQIGSVAVAENEGKAFKGLRLDVTLNDLAAKELPVKSANAASIVPASKVKQLQPGQIDAVSRTANPPQYPKDALQKNIGGTVVLVVDIAANGSVTGLKVERTSGNAQLDAATLEAAQKWRFKPAMKNGKAIAGKVRVPVEFRPDGASAATRVKPTRPTAIAVVFSASTGLPGYDAMLASLRGSWATGPQEQGC